MKKQISKRTRMASSAVAMCGLILLVSLPAQAHFLWADITSAPQPALHLTFSEDGTSPTSPRLLSRISSAKVWTAGVAPLTLAPTAGAQVAALPAAQHVAAAEETWGIYDASEAGLGTFLLRYYAKAANNTPAASSPMGLSVEVFAHRQGGQVLAQVSHDGKPAVGAEVWVAAPGATDQPILKTDAHGEVQFPVTASGKCRIRAMVAETVSGDYAGKKYTLIRDYSTLTFPVEAKAAQVSLASVPSSHPDAHADPAAYALLEAAHDARQTFAPNFPGLTAKITFDDNGMVHAGMLTFDPAGTLHVSAADLSPQAQEWLENQSDSLLTHRQNDDFATGEGRDALTLGSDDHNPLGRVVTLHDALQSSYRIKDNTLTEVTRTMGGQRFTVTVLETTPGNPGKYLPHQFAVTYFDAKTGAINRSDLSTDTFAKVDDVWVPVSRRVVQAKDGGFTTRTISFSDIHIWKP
jgi:hypothetical protein